jgi:hypothetical protein
MHLFTIDEAKSCTINKNTSKLYEDGIFKNWIMAVNDVDGYYYNWEDDETTEMASDATIKLNIYNFLITKCYKMGENPVFSSSTVDTIINTTIG